MDKIFLYWDNSNIFISAQDVAEEQEGWGARSRVRIHFSAMIGLVRRQRPIGRALAVGWSVPPELRGVWNRLQAEGIEVQRFAGQAGEAGAGCGPSAADRHAP